jgi:hypothetical protein
VLSSIDSFETAWEVRCAGRSGTIRASFDLPAALAEASHLAGRLPVHVADAGGGHE